MRVGWYVDIVYLLKKGKKKKPAVTCMLYVHPPPVPPVYRTTWRCLVICGFERTKTFITIPTSFKNKTSLSWKRHMLCCVCSPDRFVWAASKRHGGPWLPKGQRLFEDLESVWYCGRLSICSRSRQPNFFPCSLFPRFYANLQWCHWHQFAP